jgi:hypothetical protein
MKAKFAKALAKNITIIAGNVARVALLDNGSLRFTHETDRPECCERVKKAEQNIAELLMQPGCHPDAKD